MTGQSDGVSGLHAIEANTISELKVQNGRKYGTKVVERTKILTTSTNYEISE